MTTEKETSGALMSCSHSNGLCILRAGAGEVQIIVLIPYIEYAKIKNMPSTMRSSSLGA